MDYSSDDMKVVRKILVNDNLAMFEELIGKGLITSENMIKNDNIFSIPNSDHLESFSDMLTRYDASKIINFMFKHYIQTTMRWENLYMWVNYSYKFDRRFELFDMMMTARYDVGYMSGDEFTKIFIHCRVPALNHVLEKYFRPANISKEIMSHINAAIVSKRDAEFISREFYNKLYLILKYGANPNFILSPHAPKLFIGKIIPYNQMDTFNVRREEENSEIKIRYLPLFSLVQEYGKISISSFNKYKISFYIEYVNLLLQYGADPHIKISIDSLRSINCFAVETMPEVRGLLSFYSSLKSCPYATPNRLCSLNQNELPNFYIRRIKNFNTPIHVKQSDQIDIYAIDGIITNIGMMAMMGYHLMLKEYIENFKRYNAHRSDDYFTEKIPLLINYQDQFGNTALHYAVGISGSIETIKYLHGLGADFDIPNEANKTPYQLLSKESSLYNYSFEINRLIITILHKSTNSYPYYIPFDIITLIKLYL
jgi:hypothetical protein